MGPKTDALIRVLSELTALLRACGVEHWASWLEWDRLRLVEHGFRGVEHLLSAYGGMGSFNDLLLHPVNGHRVGESSVEAVNAEVSDLRSRAWELGTQIAREASFE